ncbi:hypothetical protein [Sinorhizobium sp. BJ1]|uniref:hypothetical protein n=1 Tax=Sinorhizobium sp. BJ1 TaxID=2035455 RepID=UPI0015CF181E|nr:hypothetical protein [Sinorhizobium sp. BJ1]
MMKIEAFARKHRLEEEEEEEAHRLKGAFGIAAPQLRVDLRVERYRIGDRRDS